MASYCGRYGMKQYPLIMIFNQHNNMLLKKNQGLKLSEVPKILLMIQKVKMEVNPYKLKSKKNTKVVQLQDHNSHP